MSDFSGMRTQDRLADLKTKNLSVCYAYHANKQVKLKQDKNYKQFGTNVIGVFNEMIAFIAVREKGSENVDMKYTGTCGVVL